MYSLAYTTLLEIVLTDFIRMTSEETLNATFQNLTEALNKQGLSPYLVTTIKGKDIIRSVRFNPLKSVN